MARFVTLPCDVLASTEYHAAIRCQSRAFVDGLELCCSDGFGTHGKRCACLLSSQREASLPNGGNVRHGGTVCRWNSQFQVSSIRLPLSFAKSHPDRYGDGEHSDNRKAGTTVLIFGFCLRLRPPIFATSHW
jgi:hypothetical protein